MKKLIISAVITVLCGALLFAQTRKDGFYFAQDPDFVNNQKNQVVLEVKGGKIVSANWNMQSLTPAGSQDLKAIAKTGSPAGAVTWAGQAKAAEDFLVSGQNVNATSVPNGPANVKPFFDLAKAALASSPVAKGSYKKDGWYYALDSEADGYHTRNYVLITVVNGAIVDVLWNGVLVGMPPSIDPSKIIQAKKPNGYPMTGAKNAWYLQSAAVAAELLKVQNPDSIKMNGDKADAISGASIEISHFIALAKQALQPAK